MVVQLQSSVSFSFLTVVPRRESEMYQTLFATVLMAMQQTENVLSDAQESNKEMFRRPNMA